ncbi:hypothetical protein B9479_007841 [Cryptococcus floricola]|uniref:Retrotransposon gag domain-containing protein n=1 Tax=Cryptococcus floricola TaxID=2591691 RepID=A0A5D3ALC0_9TREE|nr:hypothetical protein B9479_007841 [Cryptococcus floricola]
MPPKTIDEVIAEMEELQLAEHEPMFAIYQDLVTARKADIEKRAEEELEKKKWEDEVISLQEEKERMEKESEEQRKQEELTRKKEELALQATKILAARGATIPKATIENPVPTPVLPTTTMNQAPVSSSIPHPPHPDPFDGSDATALNSFLLASNGYLELYKAHYPSARSQIMWVACFLRGALGDRVSTALLNDELHPWLESWDAFKKYLIANYGQSKGERIAGATQALQSAAQGTRTAREYLNAL